jgi:methionyl-tRNA synthetase
LTSRTLTLASRPRDWAAPAAAGVGDELRAEAAALPAAIDAALARYDFRTACQRISGLAESGNRFIEAEAPWHLAKAADAGDSAAAARFAAVIDTLLTACRAAAHELEPFLPHGSTRLLRELAATGRRPTAVFPRIAV